MSCMGMLREVVAISSVELQVLTMNLGRNSSICGCFGLNDGSDCHPRIYNEQDILNSLGDGNVMSSINGGPWRSVMYRVHLQDPSRVVVVKKLENKTASAVDASLDDRCQSEVNLLDSICHDNIISLVACILKDNFIVLVYDHNENGSLNQWLHYPELAAEGVLDWPTRLAIAIGVARGIYYLHHGRNNPIVHHNINSSSILLDRDLKPKISGFDFARVNLAEPDQPVPIWELTAGNMFGYTAPEYMTAVTSKVDVYSLGVVMLELVTGRVANEAIADGHLATWAGKHCNRLMKNVVDFSHVIDMAISVPDRVRYFKEMLAMFRLGVACTDKDPQERPPMHEVLSRLRNRGH
ncbi:MDIS1-interacting receptor like kinase 1 isoform X3 [Brachypodium distachyon]|uniref:Protein kinase domain-containing protein n=2 Tax=Brachypodium distachyon TaxID=15368 RepID=A0A0Q3JAP7_BRADI|nr:MDIS1-interacting receptor like kinase 1 isoform X3 [Brachypodium distachyon]KQJ95360.1 hypothetical protein BRADI_3g16740v3 [Brachypodium distachyon]PNT66764.1 hypothetical protein BRADI_3g16740v3 [Brachypodium distachyon]|eukprot:XP_010234393.1 MDIS1-interacting receptor like kinase 1 isoform X3 [Brachypodium distachyon]